MVFRRCGIATPVNVIFAADRLCCDLTSDCEQPMVVLCLLFSTSSHSAKTSAMQSKSIYDNPVGMSPSGQLVSRSAILILSGVLIGTTSNQAELSGTAFTGFCAGVIGMISFFTFDRGARRRQTRNLEETLKSVECKLASRLRRHVDAEKLPAPRRCMSNPVGESSYLPVTLAWK